MESKVIDYVTEEVYRQGHDIWAIDGIQRVGWMLDAWSYALEYYALRLEPTVWDVVMLGKTVERCKNAPGLRRYGVKVGTRICPPWRDVPQLLDRLFEKASTLTPLHFYKEFELIHPFVDGNGRTGKILLNWLNGTLLDPIFPPDDLWGPLSGHKRIRI